MLKLNLKTSAIHPRKAYDPHHESIFGYSHFDGLDPFKSTNGGIRLESISRP